MNKMLPVIVSPFHDTNGLMFAHLESITPLLKSLFSRAFLSITPLTQQTQAERVEQLAADAFFALNYNQPDTLIGDHFLAGYQNAVHRPQWSFPLCRVPPSHDRGSCGSWTQSD